MRPLHRLLALAGFLLSTSASHLLAASLAAYPEGNFSAEITVLPGAGNPTRKPEYATRPTLLRVQATKIDSSYLYQLEWKSGPRTAVWTEPGFSLFQHPNGSVYLHREQIFTLPTLARMDPPSLSWVTPASYQGEQKYKEKKCLYYTREMVFEGNYRIRYHAWIDPETSLPVAMSDSDDIFEFTFREEKPVGPLVMPQILQETYDRFRQAQRPPTRL